MTKFKTASSAVIHELMDDEVIIANLDSGTYYSLRDSAIPLWQMLVAGFTVDQIKNLLNEKFAPVSEQTFNEVSLFIDQLCKENLLVSDSVTSQTQGAENLIWPSRWGNPTFEKYDEMKNLLMLDPIHEVDEQGWPNQPKKI